MAMGETTSPQLYGDLAGWWPLFSHPDDYAEEAAWILSALDEALERRPEHVLELGSGGGNLASHLTPHARVTLSDLVPAMLEVSRRFNPDAEHVEGDMRSLRLQRSFDAVVIHDAIMYMADVEDLVAALTTARVHLAPNGAVIVLPDYVAESFEPGVATGGHDARDGSGRSLRYISWAHPAEVGATAHDVDFAIMLREVDGSVEVVHDRHRCGLFPRDAWCQAFLHAGFALPSIRRDPWQRDVFVARPAAR
jgi:SAM-dependent methyltransferase